MSLEVDLMIQSKIEVLHYDRLGRGNLTTGHLLQTPNNTFVRMAIMINEATTFGMEASDFDVHSAIILHNFAVTHISLSEEPGSEHLVRVAAKLWQCSASLLTRQQMGTTADPGESTLLDDERMLFLWGLLCRNLSTVSSLLGHPRRAEQYWNALSVLFGPEEEFDQQFAGFFPVTEAAAAAA